MEIQLESKYEIMTNKYCIRSKYKITQPKELVQTYITRKDEVNTMSKFYTGEKLTWKERIQALFKGKLYGGSIELKERRNRNNE